VPPLRDRREDILPPAYHFLGKYGASSTPASDLSPGRWRPSLPGTGPATCVSWRARSCGRSR
jgi:hypothetical protein